MLLDLTFFSQKLKNLIIYNSNMPFQFVLKYARRALVNSMMHKLFVRVIIFFQYLNTSKLIMSEQERHRQISQLEEINEKKLLLSFKETQPKTPDKQITESVYSQGGKLRTISPDFIRIQNLQSLSEEDRAILNSVIRKLQNKVKIEFSCSQSHSSRGNNEGQNDIFYNLLGRVRSKQSEPQSIEQDPKQSQIELKMITFRDLLRKKVEENKEKDQQIRQLLLRIEQLNEYQSQLNILRKKYQQLERVGLNAAQELRESTASLELLQSQNLNKNKEIQQLRIINQMLVMQLQVKNSQLVKGSDGKNQLQINLFQLQKKNQHLQNQAKQNQENFERQLNQIKMRQAQNILFYREKVENYQIKLSQQKQGRFKDSQRIIQLQEEVRRLQEQSLKAKLQIEETQRRKSAIMPAIQKSLTQYIKQFDSLQSQKQNICTKNELLQRELATYQSTVQQLEKQRENLQNQVKILTEENIQSNKKNNALQIQILQLNKAKGQLQNSTQKNAKQMLNHQMTIKSKETQLKASQQKCEQLQNQLSKRCIEMKKLQKQVEKSALAADKAGQSQNIKKQSETRIKGLEQEKKAIQAKFQNDLKEKIAYYESELKRAKIEKDKWQTRCLQQSKKNNLLIEQSKKNSRVIEQPKVVKSVNSPQNPDISQLKNLLNDYKKQLQSKNNQSRIQKTKFEETLIIKDRQLAEKDDKIKQIIEKYRQSQAQFKSASQKETKQAKISMLFELLRGFKAKMTPAQLNTLRGRISFMIN